MRIYRVDRTVKIVKAHRPLSCSQCGRDIRAGENYVRDRLRGDGHDDLVVTCAHCVTHGEVLRRLRRDWWATRLIPEGIRVLDWDGDGVPWEIAADESCLMFRSILEEFLDFEPRTVIGRRAA